MSSSVVPTTPPPAARHSSSGVRAPSEPQHAEPVEAVTRSPISLRRNAAWMLAGNVTYAACQWGVWIVLARQGGPEMIGQYAIALALTAPIFMLACLGLRPLQATNTRDEIQFCDCLGLRLTTTLAALLIVAGIVLVSGYSVAAAMVILGAAIARSIESISDVIHGLYQQHERMGLIARSLALRGLLSLAGLTLGLVIDGSLLTGISLMVVAKLIALLFHDVPSCHQVSCQRLIALFRPRFHRGTLVQITRRAAPVGLVAGVVCLQANIPRYFIDGIWGVVELGMFASMVSVFAGADTIVVAINQTALPRFARHFAANQADEFRRLLWKLLGVASVLAGAGMLLAYFAGREILTLLYGAGYADRLDVFLWLAVSAAISIALRPFDVALRSMRVFWCRFYIQLGTIAPFVVANVVLVPRFGMLGAAYALVLKVALDGLLSLLVMTRTAVLGGQGAGTNAGTGGTISDPLQVSVGN